MRLAQPRKKIGVNFGNFSLEYRFQEIQTPTTAGIATTLAAMCARLRSGLGIWENTTTPCRLTFEVEQVTFVVGHRPPDGASPYVEPDIVLIRISQVHIFPFSSPCAKVKAS